ncbi:hypothetical protein MMC30_004950 [Trapelia coarctata]|nr:hypothetical protein [Trapelia coarctata]
MSGILKYFAKRLFKKQLVKYQKEKDYDHEDLLHRWVFVKDRNGNKTQKTVKIERPVPAGFSAKDTKVLLAVRRRAHRLDESFDFCGIKFGLSSFVGLLPAFGDMFDIVVAIALFFSCMQVEGGLDWTWHGFYAERMILNIIFDGLVGFVPLLGDLGDAVFRCNKRNANLLEKMVESRNARWRKQGKLPPLATEMTPGSDGRITTQPSLTTMSYPSNLQTTNLGPPSRHENSYEDRDYSFHNEPARPEPARLNNSTGGGRGWFGRLMDPHKERDVELGGRVEMRERVEQPSGPRRFINGDDLRRAKEAPAR